MNSLRRAVAFPNDPERYLRITTNSQARYEDVMGETYLTGVMRMKDASVKRTRAVLYVGLLHEPGMTLEKAGEVMDELGLVASITLATEAMKAANPEVVSGNVQAAEGQVTTGTTSSASGKRGLKPGKTPNASGN